MKKIDIDTFCSDMETTLVYFRKDMVSKNFSKRNSTEWFKMLGDYFGIDSVTLDKKYDAIEEDSDF